MPSELQTVLFLPTGPEHGTDNHKQRLEAGLLPWKESHESVDEWFFAELDATFAPDRRFDTADVCVCVQSGRDLEACQLSFQSIDAAELIAKEWELYSKVKAAAPEADFQLREHRAKCKSATEQAILHRRS
jgi:hypothetical protein